MPLWGASPLTPINLRFYCISHTILGARLAFDQIELNVCQPNNKITQRLAFVKERYLMLPTVRRHICGVLC